jgi:hypothetical protein
MLLYRKSFLYRHYDVWLSSASLAPRLSCKHDALHLDQLIRPISYTILLRITILEFANTVWLVYIITAQTIGS